MIMVQIPQVKTEGDKVVYLGPFENCQKSEYKVIKVYQLFSSRFYDLEYFDLANYNILSGAYKLIYSVPESEIKLIKE